MISLLPFDCCFDFPLLTYFPVGERNHCRFWWFVTAQAVAFGYLVHTIGSSPYGFVTLLPARHTNHHHLPFGNVDSNNKDDYALVYKSLLVIAAKLYVYPLAFVGWLVWAVHTFLAFTNSTTFEMTKGPSHLEYLRGTQITDLPYSFRSLDQNLAYFCCQRDALCDTPWDMSLLLCCGARKSHISASSSSWKPTIWYPPSKVVRDSEDWWKHPWQNKYWSCC